MRRGLAMLQLLVAGHANPGGGTGVGVPDFHRDIRRVATDTLAGRYSLDAGAGALLRAVAVGRAMRDLRGAVPAFLHAEHIVAVDHCEARIALRARALHVGGARAHIRAPAAAGAVPRENEISQLSLDKNTSV